MAEEEQALLRAKELKTLRVRQGKTPTQLLPVRVDDMEHMGQMF